MSGKKKLRVACPENLYVAQQLMNEICHFEDVKKDRMIIVHRKALRSVCAYPMHIKTKQQARSLSGVGEFLAQKIAVWAEEAASGAKAAPALEAIPSLEEREPVDSEAVDSEVAPPASTPSSAVPSAASTVTTAPYSPHVGKGEG